MIILTAFSGSSATNGIGDEDGDESGDADEIDRVGETLLSEMPPGGDVPFSQDEDNVRVDIDAPAIDESGDC